MADERFGDRLRTAYVTALKEAHSPGRVEIHLGENVVDHLRKEFNGDDLPAPTTMFGIPVVIVPEDDHIAVHKVQVIE